MNTYKRHRFPPDIISYTVWLYFRFNLSHRDIEDLLAERGVTVSREAIRLWCIKFGALYTRRLKRKHRECGDIARGACLCVLVSNPPSPVHPHRITEFSNLHRGATLKQLCQRLNMAGTFSIALYTKPGKISGDYD
jgi:hypothetical protein